MTIKKNTIELMKHQYCGNIFRLLRSLSVPLYSGEVGDGVSVFGVALCSWRLTSLLRRLKLHFQPEWVFRKREKASFLHIVMESKNMG
ncbi:hypothetical protein DPMN_070489 [Dreissena polymorpha]|uniref:Uncharacterized protein n=1 Tax=Dreissena polymorpha TaxID=45954 RepID=A0A9D4BV52_DREPO|nr:hypothetical protein DPMN_070489 [Dreissena polymorpha]